MPPNDRPDIADLAKRIKVLEEKKVSVKDLPITQLRRSLAKEPQNPTDILLPHSVGPELLQDGVIKGREECIYIAASGAVNVGSGFVVTIPVTGVYDITFNTPFATLPVSVASPYPSQPAESCQAGPINNSWIRVICLSPAGAAVAAPFCLIVKEK